MAEVSGQWWKLRGPRRALARRRKRLRDSREGVRADACLVSFPKCGRTWLRLMIGEALNGHFQLGADVNTRLDVWPLHLLDPQVPAIYVHHDNYPADKTPDELRPSKRSYRRTLVILLVRDPRDAIVSQYFQVTKRRRRTVTPYPGTMREFVHERRGSVATFIAYYNQWAAARDTPRGVLLVRYEDLHADPARELRRILSFVGVEDVTADVIDAAVEAASFNRMRALEAEGELNSSRLRPGRADDVESYKTRKGQVGG